MNESIESGMQQITVDNLWTLCSYASVIEMVNNGSKLGKIYLEDKLLIMPVGSYLD